MIKRTIQTGVLLFAYQSISMADDSTAQLRAWNSKSGEHTVMAALVDYDPVRKKATLRKEDSSEIIVPLTRLSSADQAYLGGLAKNEQGDASGEMLYGIRWQPDFALALDEAAGESGVSDDRPVMWFRVLGELDGGL